MYDAKTETFGKPYLENGIEPILTHFQYSKVHAIRFDTNFLPPPFSDTLVHNLGFLDTVIENFYHMPIIGGHK